MANNGEARQYSFTMGEISPEKYYTPNEVTYQQGLAKAENVIVKASGGIATRAGTTYRGSLDSALDATDAQVPHVIIFEHPITKVVHTIAFREIPVTGGYSLYLDGEDIMDQLHIKNSLFPRFGTGGVSAGKIQIPDDIKLSFTMSSEYLIVTPAIKLYSGYFSDVSGYFNGDPVGGYYTETIIALKFFKPEAGPFSTFNKGIRAIANFGGQLNATIRESGPKVKITASGEGTAPSATSRVSYILTATRQDGCEEIFLAVRSNDTASSNIDPAINIVSTQWVDATSSGALYFPVSGYRTKLKIENIWLGKDALWVPKYKYFSLYRGVENDPNYTTSFSLVNRFPVYKSSSDTFTINVTDSGESDSSITPPMDRSFFIQTPSIIEMDGDTSFSTFSPNKIISAAFYQSRLFAALSKSENFETEATSNTILASKLNAPEQMSLPLILNPAEAFSFQVPEESGGYLTHLAASSRLIAFTNKSVFVFMGDESGTLSPLVLNPIKVFQVGSKASVAPCTFGEYTFFAMEGVPSIGFIRITSQGEVSYGDALPISRHIFEDNGDQIIAMKILNGPDTSQIRAQVLTERNRLIELTGTDGVFGLSKVVKNPIVKSVPTALIENKVTLKLKAIEEYIGGVFYRNRGAAIRYYMLPYTNLTSTNSASKFFNPYVDFSLREGFFDTGVSWENLKINSPIQVIFDSYFLNSPTNTYAFFDPSITDWNQGATIPIELFAEGTVVTAPIPEQYARVLGDRKFAIKFFIKDSQGAEHSITGELQAIGAGPHELVFDQEIPELFRDKFFKMYSLSEQNSNFESADYLAGISGIAVFAANKLYVPAQYNNSYFEAMAEARNIPVVADAEIPIGLFADGEVICDLTEDVPPIKAVYRDMGVDGFFWEVDFNGQFFSSINMGIPYISEVQTLPIEVAVGQGDSISDAGKLISAISVSLYKTDSLLIGEADQSDEYLTDIEFTTDQSPTAPVKFNGVKEYSFSASWNKDGMVRLRSKPFRGFSISSITPKGNVSV